MNKEKIIKPQVSTAKIASPDFFEKVGNKGVFLALGLIMLVAFFVFKDFILLKKLYLFKDIGSDSLNGAFPFFYNYANYFERYGIPSWSFQEGLGQNIIGGFLRDPFMLIGYLAGPSSMPKIYVFIELIEILSGGVVFYFFLKTLKASNFAATLGCLLFSFSGFNIIGSCWYVFTYESFTLALLLLGFELYYQKNKWLVFVIAIALIGISMPFNLYIEGLIVLFYIIFRLGKDGKLKLKPFALLILKLAIFGIIGILISGPFLLESGLLLLNSPRGSGSTSYFELLSSKPMFEIIDKFQFGTFITRLFSSDYIGSGNGFKGWQNFLEAPLSYCGLLSIILMPQIFTTVSKSVRKWYIFWLLVWLLPTLFPYFRYVFWLFAGDYYRIFSFCLSLVFIVYSVFAIDVIFKTRKINIITLGITILLSIVLLNYNYFKGTPASVDKTIAIFDFVWLFTYGILLFFITKWRNNNNLKYALIALVCFELAFLSSFSVNRRDVVSTREFSEKIGYNDYSIEAVHYIKKNESGFYRIDKNYYSSGAIHGSLNDNRIHDYFGTSSYSSFANNNYISYLRSYGVIGTLEHESRWSPGLINRPILQSLNNVKYIMIKGYTNPVWHNTCDSVAKFGDVLVLKNKFSLPLGYTYDQYIKKSDFDKLSLNQKDFVSLQAFVLKDEDVGLAPGLKKYNPADTLQNSQFSFEKYKEEVDMLGKNSLKLSAFNDIKFAGEINVDAPKVMYLAFPYDKGWHLKLDGATANLMYVNDGMSGVYLPKGNHKVELEFKLRLFDKGLVLSLIGVLFIILIVILNKKNVNILKFINAPIQNN